MPIKFEKAGNILRERVVVKMKTRPWQQSCDRPNFDAASRSLETGDFLDPFGVRFCCFDLSDNRRDPGSLRSGLISGFIHASGLPMIRTNTEKVNRIPRRTAAATSVVICATIVSEEAVADTASQRFSLSINRWPPSRTVLIRVRWRKNSATFWRMRLM